MIAGLLQRSRVGAMGERGAAGGRLYPKPLPPGEAEEIGEARVSLSRDGLLEACDRYGCSRARLPPGRGVHLEPVPALGRPEPLTSCIYVEFDAEVLHPGGSMTVWSLAPYEVAVTYENVVLARLTPLPSKLTLVGDLVEGRICRHHRSGVYESREEALASRAPGEAVLAVSLSGPPARVPGVAFYAAMLPIYTDEGGALYYPLVEMRIEEAQAMVRTTSQPPAAGLEVAQRGRRPLLLQPALPQPLPPRRL